MHALLVNTTTGDWVRLGRYVKDRREALRLTQQEMAARGGPSIATIRNIEAASRDAYRGRTYSQLEEALGWEHGSVEAVLRGGEPSPVAGTRTDTPATAGKPRRHPKGTNLGEVLVERGLRRREELVESDDVVDPIVQELLESPHFDDAFKNRWLLDYSALREQTYSEVREQRKRPRD